MDQKYVEFSDFDVRGSGFGNQLRAFIKAVIVSKITKRKLIVSNYWINTLFECPYGDKWDMSIRRQNKTIKKIKPAGHGSFNPDYRTLNFNSVKADIIEISGGDLSLNDIILNKHHKESKIIQKILNDKYNFLRAIIVELKAYI